MSATKQLHAITVGANIPTNVHNVVVKIDDGNVHARSSSIFIIRDVPR